MKAEVRAYVFQFLWSLPCLCFWLFCGFFCAFFVCFPFLSLCLVPCAAISVMDQSQTRGHWSSQWWKNRKQERQQKFNIFQQLGQQWESITLITMLLLISISEQSHTWGQSFLRWGQNIFLGEERDGSPSPPSWTNWGNSACRRQLCLIWVSPSPSKILFFFSVDM